MLDVPVAKPDPLIEALDRLRTTDAGRPAEDEILNLLRARRIYQDGA